MRVARYAASPEAVYAMFSGGGASYAEAELKAGRIAIAPAPTGRAAGPDRPLLPLVADRIAARRHPLHPRRAGARRLAGGVPERRDRGHPDDRGGGARRPSRCRRRDRNSPSSRRPCGSRRRRRGRARRACRRFAQIARRDGVRRCTSIRPGARRALRPEALSQLGGQELRLPQIRRCAAHDDRLHVRPPPTRLEALLRKAEAERIVDLRPAPAGRRADDLHRALLCDATTTCISSTAPAAAMRSPRRR